MPGDTRRYTFGGKPIFLFGEKAAGIGNPKNIQDFYKIRDECLKAGKLFEDPEFPANDSSIYYSQRPQHTLKWLRPKEICKVKPKFIDEKGFSRFDVQQGSLGDCWFLAATANLTQDKKLFSRVVCEDNSFDNQYAGIFHFVFWQYGKWVDVVVDDRLPTYYGQLYYMHSSDKSEFWSALLEKAYAKLNGSYQGLIGGITSEALEDFTGGITENFNLKEPPKKLFHIMAKGFRRNSMIGCSIEPLPGVTEARTPQGLVRGHAYSITKASMFDIATQGKTEQKPLLRIRNPWGDNVEWNGAWSDKSKEWSSINEKTRNEIGLNFDSDGEFWMSYPDFTKYFTKMDICNLGPDSMVDMKKDGSKTKWNVDMFEGEWVKGISAGGCRNPGNPFQRNPQYVITLREADDDDNDGKCSVVIALMQKNRRSRRTTESKYLNIGFAVYQLKESDLEQKPQTMEFFNYHYMVGQSPAFTNLREITVRFKFSPGHYLIVPSTFEPDMEGEFLIRVFSESKHTFEKNEEESGEGEIDSRIADTPEKSDVDSAVQSLFNVYAGENQEIDWEGLKKILDAAFSGESKGFSKDICRSMVAMLDYNRSGSLGLKEFDTLITDTVLWQRAFKLYDTDKTNLLNAFEFRDALASAGYRLNNDLLKTLIYRYGSKDKMISFEDFILCAVKVKTMIEIYKEKDINHDNRAVFSMDEWIMKALYS